MLSCSLSRSDIPGVQGLENRARSLFFLSPTPRKRHSKSADKAVTVLRVKILAFPVSPAIHCNKANKRVWKESRREDVSCKARDRHQKKQSLKSMAL